MKRKFVVFGLMLPAMLCAADTARERLGKATEVLRDIRSTPDKGVPQELLEKAQCIVVVPGLKKIAFVGGGKFGKGYASCMTSHGWSGPAGIRIEGGSFGLQLGASSTDVIMLVMNQGGMTKLMSDKFTLGGDASASAGPVGRTVTANTDVLLKAEILSYSRARGLFAGLSLDGATLRPDADANKELYGTDVTNEAILNGTAKRPVAAASYLSQVQRFSGKGGPPVVKAKTKKLAATDSSASDQAVATTASTSDVNGVKTDNTKRNKVDRDPAVPTADNSKNNATDLDIARKIRRSIVADKTLSIYAHNVKVIAQNGKVTLRGPVHSDDEKANVEAKATAVAGAGNVTDNITITPPK